MCVSHNCGKPMIKWENPYKTYTFIDIQVRNFCAECEAPLLTRVKFEKGEVTLHTLPHQCPIPEPEEPGKDPDTAVLEMIEKWESGTYHNEGQKRATLQSAILDLIGR